jgi:uncharacterized protein YgbK (DUF1537 family)
MALPNIGIIADDLTGAMDSASAMAAHGLSAEVFLDYSHELGSATTDIICINTQSRLMYEPQAMKAVTSATKLLRAFGCNRLYKKIDSTLRGNVGEELTAMITAAGKRRAFVCPAFPEMGRTVRDGIIEVNGRRLTVSREGNDPFNSVGEASVVRLLQKQTKGSVGHVPIGIIERGAEAVDKRIQELFADGCDLIVLDAITTVHMSTLASVITRNYPGEIAVGSAGLASALAKAISHIQTAKEKAIPTVRQGRYLVISGSLHPASQKQVQQLAASLDVALLPINAADMLQEQASINAVATRIAQEIARAFASGQHAALYWQDPESLRTLLEDESTNDSRVQVIAEFYRGVLEKLHDQSKLAGLIVVGGETAYMVARAVQVRSVLITDEVSPGIPVGRLVGGLAAGRLLLTKAGGFGGHTTLVEVIEYLESNSYIPL